MKRTDNRRVIMRIEVSGGVPQRLDAVTARWLSTHIAINSRVVTWLCEQDEETIATILGLMPAGHEIDLPRRVFESMRG
jgi:hypothetical protein